MICVIPARGGSKRLPGKNLKEFHGKTLIRWAMDVALECEDLFTDIVLSSDSEEVLVRAIDGIWAHLRSPGTATDKASMRDVALEVIQDLGSTDKGSITDIDAVCILPPTAPLRTAEDVRKCVALFSENTPCVMAVSHYNLPPWQVLFRDGDLIRPYWGDLVLHKKGQEIPPLFCDAGSVYVVSREHLLKGPTLYHSEMKVVEIPIWRAADIDDAEGFKYAEVLGVFDGR